MTLLESDTTRSRPSDRRSRHVVALVLGCLLLLPGVSLLLGGGGLALAYAFGRDSSGYFSSSLAGVQTSTAAIVDRDLPVTVDPGVPVRLLDAVDARVRLRVHPLPASRWLFLGIGPVADVDRYLAAVAHDDVVRISGGTLVHQTRPGGRVAVSPTAQTFWAATATGPGALTLDWRVRVSSGSWAVVVMNADGTPGVATDSAFAAVRSGLILPLAVGLLCAGALLSTAAALAIILGAAGGHRRSGSPVPFSAGQGPAPANRTKAHSPVVLEARLDPELSRWTWLVKWLLAVPHLLVLALLWPAFVTVAVVAGVCILCTGRFPRPLFAFNVGVLRWSWRVSFYAASGGIGTDRYPPFTLGPAADYPATLDIAYPERLSRGLVLVKWWLLALPQYFIVGLLVNGWWGWTSAAGGNGLRIDPVGGGILGLLVLVAGIMLLVTGRYPMPLFDVIVGFNRWIYRVIAYAALMTDTYPPFRLDEGGTERPTPPAVPADPAPDQLDLRVPVQAESRR